jgi:hypothetical protein
MTKLAQLLEEMSARLNEITATEHTLVRALGDALSRVDQKLLHDVRSITAEHETRRGAILNELQNLATRIGTFPQPHESLAGIEYAASAPRTALNGHKPITRGDWRQAANNVDSELDLFYGENASQH